jgi:hypothetical protein
LEKGKLLMQLELPTGMRMCEVKGERRYRGSRAENKRETEPAKEAKETSWALRRRVVRERLESAGITVDEIQPIKFCRN